LSFGALFKNTHVGFLGWVQLHQPCSWLELSIQIKTSNYQGSLLGMSKLQ